MSFISDGGTTKSFGRRRSTLDVIPEVRIGLIVLKEGWLQKQSAHIGRWKPRWCVLTADFLTTYKSQHHDSHIKQAGETEPYPLLDCSEASKDASKDRAREFGVTFRVKGRREYLLLAASAQDRDAWISHFNRVRAEALHKASQSELSQSMPPSMEPGHDDSMPVSPNSFSGGKQFSVRSSRLDAIVAPRWMPNTSFNSSEDPEAAVLLQGTPNTSFNSSEVPKAVSLQGTPNSSFNSPEDPKATPDAEARTNIVGAKKLKEANEIVVAKWLKDAEIEKATDVITPRRGSTRGSRSSLKDASAQLQFEVVEFEAVDRQPGADAKTPSTIFFKIAVRPLTGPPSEVHHVMKSHADLQVLCKDLAPDFEKKMPTLPPAPRPAGPGRPLGEEARLPLNAFLSALASKRKICASKHFLEFFKLSHDFAPSEAQLSAVARVSTVVEAEHEPEHEPAEDGDLVVQETGWGREQLFGMLSGIAMFGILL